MCLLTQLVQKPDSKCQVTAASTWHAHHSDCVLHVVHSPKVLELERSKRRRNEKQVQHLTVLIVDAEIYNDITAATTTLAQEGGQYIRRILPPHGHAHAHAR